MSYGKKILKKYGWNEGEGLGKNCDGINEALKPKRKSNVLGFGYKTGNEFKDHWWENVFDNAASNIIVKTDNEGGSCSITNLTPSETNIHKRRHKSSKRSYSNFIKETEIMPEEEITSSKNLLSDDTIFKKCGGRTVHKGARHGLTLSGKLSRLEKQEQQLCKKNIADDILPETKKKRKIK